MSEDHVVGGDGFVAITILTTLLGDDLSDPFSDLTRKYHTCPASRPVTMYDVTLSKETLCIAPLSKYEVESLTYSIVYFVAVSTDPHVSFTLSSPTASILLIVGGFGLVSTEEDQDEYSDHL